MGLCVSTQRRRPPRDVVAENALYTAQQVAGQVDEKIDHGYDPDVDTDDESAVGDTSVAAAAVPSPHDSLLSDHGVIREEALYHPEAPTILKSELPRLKVRVEYDADGYKDILLLIYLIERQYEHHHVDADDNVRFWLQSLITHKDFELTETLKDELSYLPRTTLWRFHEFTRAGESKETRASEAVIGDVGDILNEALGYVKTPRAFPYPVA